jgi:hypothetical protein
MNSELTENVQTSIRPGMDVDTYYYGDTNSEKQAYPCIVNNKFIQQFTNLGAGTSQFIVSPYQGVSDMVVYMKMKPTAITGYGLPTSWGYSMIRQVSVRYGSSAQFFFSGEQLYMQNIFDCEDSMKRDQLVSLGGNATTDISGAEAYLYLNLPHNSPRADGKPLPFPSDLLVQPIVITIELNSPASVLVPMEDESQVGTPETQLAEASLQVKQEMMSDSADLLARRVDMNSHAYTFPLKYFPQQEVQINAGVGSTSASAPVSVNLTGFRAGEVRNILLWLTNTDDVALNGSHYWNQISNVQLTYNGEIYFKTASSASQIWNLVCDTKEAGANIVQQDGSGGFESALATYVDIPFAQVNVPYDKEIKLMHGKPILNAVVNLSFTTPSVLSAGKSWTLHALYLYNSSLLCSRGSAEYIF